MISIKSMIEIIIEQRKLIEAPVDMYGCAAISKLQNTNKNFTVFVSVLLSSLTMDPITYQAVLNLLSLHNNNLTPDTVLLSEKEELYKCIKKVGFHNKKLIYLIECSKAMAYNKRLLEDPEIKDILALPGIGKKMAYLYLSVAFNNHVGMASDRHVTRIIGRLLNTPMTPEKASSIIERFFEPEKFLLINHSLVGFGQKICLSNKPKCEICNVRRYCGHSNKNLNW